jgi:hypothetical protein
MLRSRMQPAVADLRTVDLVQEIGALSHRLETSDDLSPLLDRIGDARFVLLGEALPFSFSMKPRRCIRSISSRS